MNGNYISCVPNLKIAGKNHVVQEFNKSYYKRKQQRGTSLAGGGKDALIKSNSARSHHYHYLHMPHHHPHHQLTPNEVMVKEMERPTSEMNLRNSNTFRNSFILEENEEEDEEQQEEADADAVETVVEEAGAEDAADEQAEEVSDVGPVENNNNNLSTNNTTTTKQILEPNVSSPPNIAEQRSEMRHASSFVLNENDKTTAGFDLPFAELQFINLADNNVSGLLGVTYRLKKN